MSIAVERKCGSPSLFADVFRPEWTQVSTENDLQNVLGIIFVIGKQCKRVRVKCTVL
jgi:hypothetical protein